MTASRGCHRSALKRTLQRARSSRRKIEGEANGPCVPIASFRANAVANDALGAGARCSFAVGERMADLGLRLVAILGVGKSAEQERRYGDAEAWLHFEDRQLV
eukprot:3310977-Rhodomonas_salina.1